MHHVTMKKYLVTIVVTLVLLQFASGGKVKPQLCSLPHSADGYVEPVVWRCHGQLPLWSYNQETNECVEFRYGGCGGNDNAFFSQEHCEETCKC